MLTQSYNPFRKFSTSHRALSYFDGLQWWVIDTHGLTNTKERPLFKFTKKYLIVEEFNFQTNTNNQLLDIWLSGVKNKKYNKSITLELLLKLLNFVTFGYYGINYKKLRCSDIFISFCETVLNLRMGDPDHYDLLETDRVAEWVRDYYGDTEFIN